MAQPNQTLPDLSDQQEKAVPVGRFQILNLDMVREAAGEAWARLGEKLFAATETFIARRLEAGDVLFRCSEGVLVIYDRSRADQAAALTQSVIADLNRFYLNDEVFRMFKAGAKSELLDSFELAFLAKTLGIDNQQPSKPALGEDADWRADLLKAGFAYKPVYDIQRQGIVSSYCTPVRSVAGELQYGHRPEQAFEVRETADLDFKLQAQALKALEDSWASEKPAAVCLTPNYRTLVNARNRQTYFAPILNLPDKFSSLITVRIDGTPDGAPLSRIEEITSYLRTLKLKYMVDCASLNFDLARYADCPIQAFGGPVHDIAQSSRLKDNAYKMMSEFVQRAKRLGSETYATGVYHEDTLKALVSMGVRWVSGPYVAKPSRRLGEVQPLALSTLITADDDMSDMAGQAKAG